jgi:predicted NAD/FAD-dependent oxidoreductase
MTLTNQAISVAQGLPSFDWHVFPVNSDTKATLIAGWQSRATCEWSGIIEMFKDNPSVAIASVTGQKSGLVVIDISVVVRVAPRFKKTHIKFIK